MIDDYSIILFYQLFFIPAALPLNYVHSRIDRPPILHLLHSCKWWGTKLLGNIHYWVVCLFPLPSITFVLTDEIFCNVLVQYMISSIAVVQASWCQETTWWYYRGQLKSGFMSTCCPLSGSCSEMRRDESWWSLMVKMIDQCSSHGACPQRWFARPWHIHVFLNSTPISSFHSFPPPLSQSIHPPVFLLQPS